MADPHVEILYFEGCPNHEDARALVERVAAEIGVEPQVELVRVPDAKAAVAARFLGSPTVRVNGRDVEPGADERSDVAFSCRVYRSDYGLSGQPSEGWIRQALTELGVTQPGEYGEGLPPRVAAALAAAEIPPSRLGVARHARLSDSEREFYFWILRRFATHGRPSGGEMAAAAERFGLEVQDALETFAREDLIHLDGDGEVAVAYPFSGRVTVHKVRFEGGHEAHAMCAIDALGIAPMFDQAVCITSTDPLTGESVRTGLTAEGEGTAEPASAVVVAGVIDRSDESFRGCCPVLNFFASAENGERWLQKHREIRGQVVTMPEAVTAGRAVFGDVFR